jgi:hypothetical protein
MAKSKAGPNRKQRRKGKAPKHVTIRGEPCRCRTCMKARQKPREWPRHYMGVPIRQDRDRPSPNALQSFECHLEGATCDPELLEELTALRNEPERVGSVTVERRRRL